MKQTYDIYEKQASPMIFENLPVKVRSTVSFVKYERNKKVENIAIIPNTILTKKLVSFSLYKL